MAAKKPLQYVHGLTSHQSIRLSQHIDKVGGSRKALLETAIESYLNLLEERKKNPTKTLSLAVVDDETGKIVKSLR